MQAAIYVCHECGLAYEVKGRKLDSLKACTAASTTHLAVTSAVRYLPMWRFAAQVQVKEKLSRSGVPAASVWDQVIKAAEPRIPHVYVPAFAFGRQVVQQLGAGLVERQPRLQLREGVPPERLECVGSIPQRQEEGEEGGPGFGTTAPVLLSRRDAETVAHYVYLAVENRGTMDMRGIDYQMDLGPGELVFLPAVYDKRYVRDSGWRLLLEEFDGLVA